MTMFYAALTMWLMVIVFTAHGIHRLWTGMVKPRIVNTILLPGTLIAQLGYVLGCFASGSPVSNVVLMGSDQSGDAQAAPPQPRIPLIGTMIVALGPLITCALGIYFVARYLGGSVLGRFASGAAQKIPLGIDQFWTTLHGAIDLAADFLAAFNHSSIFTWRYLLLLYLTICLTVRMAPVPGNLRGSVLAIVGFGIIMAGLGSLSNAVYNALNNAWPVLTFAAAGLLCLMIVTLLIRGIVSLAAVLMQKS